MSDHLKVDWILDRSDRLSIDGLTADLKAPFAID